MLLLGLVWESIITNEYMRISYSSSCIYSSVSKLKESDVVRYRGADRDRAFGPAVCTVQSGDRIQASYRIYKQLRVFLLCGV